MKFKKNRVAFLLTLVIGYFVVYYALHGIEVYVPVDTPKISDNFVVVLDAGHGGLDGGAVSVSGALEKDINLSIVLKLRDMLNSFGYNVVLTRDKDISIHDKGVKGAGKQKRSDMDNRLAIFNKYSNAVALSIHQNQFTQSQYNGAQMFYTATNDMSEKLATTMQKQFVEYIQPKNKRETKLVGEELFLINFAKCPSLIVECGFLSNPTEAALLESDEYQSKVAFTIFTGLNKFISENM